RHRKLAERLDLLLRRRDSAMMTLRLLLLVDGLFILFCLYNAAVMPSAAAGHGGILFVGTAVGGLAYFLISDLLGRHLSGLAAGRYLVVFSYLVQILAVPLLPILWPLRLLHARIEAWQGKRQGAEEERATTEDEIMFLVESDSLEEDSSNELEEDERRMIRGVFDLDETLVREIMTPRVDLKTLPDTATVEDVRSCIVETGHSRIPVYHESIDHIVGVLYSKDLINEARVQAAAGLDELFHTPLFIPESKNVGDLLADFQQCQIHFAVVLDEYGGTAGVVSIEDVLEEIVGEIRDEYDIHETEPELVRNEDGSVTAEARVPLSDVLEMLDMELPEKNDCETLGGYITSSIGRIPASGETVENSWFDFDIIEADMRRVLKARVRPSNLSQTDGLGQSQTNGRGKMS
ncbi:MAG: hemolysin family protein, partial [Verrucomicrobiota bacterium]